MEPKLMHPSSSRAFQKDQYMKHPGSVHHINTNKTKQNKQTTSVDRLVWPVQLAQVLPRSQLIFPFKTWFFGIYLNFQWQKSLKNSISPTF
jgi:hypothetical protein